MRKRGAVSFVAGVALIAIGMNIGERSRIQRR
jgi:hypothetical protein